MSIAERTPHKMTDWPFVYWQDVVMLSPAYRRGYFVDILA